MCSSYGLQSGRESVFVTCVCTLISCWMGFISSSHCRVLPRFAPGQSDVNVTKRTQCSNIQDPRWSLSFHTHLRDFIVICNPNPPYSIHMTYMTSRNWEPKCTPLETHDFMSKQTCLSTVNFTKLPNLVVLMKIRVMRLTDVKICVYLSRSEHPQRQPNPRWGTPRLPSQSIALRMKYDNWLSLYVAYLNWNRLVVISHFLHETINQCWIYLSG